MKGLGFACEIAAGVPPVVVGDPVRLQQVLVNLVGNAIKFTHGGTVSVRVALESRSEGAVALRASVSDTGIGIPADKQSSIFDAFTQADGSTTRQYGGTGLGLAICAQLVQRMGGRIWVESMAGRGSTFQFVVPFQVPARDRQTPSPPSGERGRGPSPADAGGDCGSTGPEMPPLRILLAEDNPINRLAMTRLLEKRGCHVVAVENGREALAAFDREPIDLVLMDVQMPDLDGLEATAALRVRERNRGTRVPVIALTAHAMRGDRERCLVAGMDEYVTKPVQPEELLGMIARAVQRRPAPGRTEHDARQGTEVLRHETLRANTGDDRALLREIVDLFRVDGPRALAEIRDGLRIRDVWSVERAAHRLKGSLATFGAFAAHAVAERVVAAARGGDVDEARAAFVALEGELQRLAPELSTAADGEARR
jgi:CheY-like chemotaxis protein/HPt (histidine-containing phosphotransfer) domain-containing protein